MRPRCGIRSNSGSLRDNKHLVKDLIVLDPVLLTAPVVPLLIVLPVPASIDPGRDRMANQIDLVRRLKALTVSVPDLPTSVKTIKRSIKKRSRRKYARRRQSFRVARDVVKALKLNIVRLNGMKWPSRWLAEKITG
jgi:hypothetical protein